MNCQEVQGQLSDYVDLSVSAAQSLLVEEHLAVCPPCREEAELLGQSIREVAALPWVDTPLGFTQRVMSHVREVETQPSFWQRFFPPFNGKIPAQATALIIVGFLGIYLLQREETHQPLTPAPESPTAGAMKQDSAPLIKNEPGGSESSEVARFENSLTQKTPQIAPSRSRPQSGRQTESRRGAEDPASPRVGSSPTTPFSAPPATEPPLRVKPIVSGTSVVTTPAQPNSGAAPFTAQPDSDNAGLRATPAAIELFADLELILRRHTTPPAEARSDVAAELRNAEGNQATAERPATPRPIDRLMAAIPDRTRPQTIWINVPQDQYEQFKKELQTLGVIESENRVPLLRTQAAHQDGHIRVKLTALPAGETATPQPATGR
jgi:hypothetical protein